MYNPFSLTGKNIVITGASSGIGQACAIACSKMGANIVLIARNEERLKETYNQLEKSKHLYYSQDVTEYKKIELIIQEAVSRVGKISGFIHSAGISLTMPLKDLKEEHFKKIFEVNTISGFRLAKFISKKKAIHQDGASFVFIASVNGVFGQPGKTLYSASKGAIIAGVKSMALEFVPKKIRVNSISPGVVKTEMFYRAEYSKSKEALNKMLAMHPLGFGSPADIANSCIFLLSDASKWVTGTNLIVDGGYCAR